MAAVAQEGVIDEGLDSSQYAYVEGRAENLVKYGNNLNWQIL